MSITVLKAFGPNDIVVIPMVFENLATGEAFVDKVFAPFQDKTVIETRASREIGKEVLAFQKIVKDKAIVYDMHWQYMDAQDAGGNYLVHEKFFKSYSDGHGGIYKYVLEEVESGTKLCVFDLD